MREQLVNNIFTYGEYEDERQDTMNSRTLSRFSKWKSERFRVNIGVDFWKLVLAFNQVSFGF